MDPNYYRDETFRLRASINRIINYAKAYATLYDMTAEEGGWMAQYFRGKADALGGVVAVATAAYGADYRTEGEADGDGE